MNDDGRIYWRSLRALAGDEAARAFCEREFPEGASELPEGVSRRTMLALLGASVSMAGLAGCRRPAEAIVPYVTAPEQQLPGMPLDYATSLPLGLGAYGVLVESHEGRPTKIEGNALHPATAGATSAWMQATILDLYDPDRLQRVEQGDEPRGWPEFVTAWKGLEAQLLASGGAGLAILTESFASPTLARLTALLSQRFPGARLAVYEAVSDENVLRGLAEAAGRPLQPVYHLDRAQVVLALDADLLLADTDSVRAARGFADRRRLGQPSDGMSRLWVAESVYSLTGANADHRLRLPSWQIPALTAHIAAALGAGGPAPDLAGVDRRFLDAVVADLLAHRGAGLIAAGRRQPPAVHAAVLAANVALGNVGRTVTYHEPRDAALPDGQSLARLVGAMREGAVGTLVIIGGNPAYDAPADLDFANAVTRVPQVIRLGTHRDETARLAHWRLPRAHVLEAWGDARALDGTLGVVQPLIEPLFGGRSAIELLALLATGQEVAGHELVRETWRGLIPAAELDLAWSRVLHDGLLSDSASPAFEPAGVGFPAAIDLSGPAGSGLELVFQSSPYLLDGRFANNGWLQELPDPLTKLTWGNAAVMSPRTAQALGVADEDVVRLATGGREIEAPVYVLPGHADESVSVTLGYGRRAAGRVGDAVGFDAYALRGLAAADCARDLTVTPTGRKQLLAQTQEHGTMHGRPIVREADLEAFREHPEFAREMVEHPPLESPWTDHRYDQGHQWGMSIDLNACTGCNACVVACQSENNIPIVGAEQVRRGREMQWLRIDRYFVSPASDPADLSDRPELAQDDARIAFMPVPCMHCENAPCEQVCPVAATVHDNEGLNTMVYNRCIGTRYCSNNCPYKVRRFNFFNYTVDTPEIHKLGANPDVTVRSRGVMEKCTYCVQRINAGKVQAKLEERGLRDGEIRTACEQACPTQAIVFGDLRDAASRVVRAKANARDYALLGELNNRPRTTYLARIRNPHPELAPARPQSDHEA